MRPVVLLLLLLILPACGDSEKITETDLQVSAQYEGGLGDEVDHNWLKRFDSQELEDLVTAALMGNRELKAARLRLEAALSDVDIAWADLYPQLDARANGGRSRANFIGLSLPGSSSVITTRNWNAGASLNISWELDIWGRLRSAAKATQQEALALQMDVRALELSLAAQVAKAYFATLEIRQQLVLAEGITKQLTQKRDLLKSRYVEGLSAVDDYRQTEVELSSQTEIHEEWRRQYVEAIRQLNLLLGDYPDSRLELTGSLPGLPDTVPTGLPAELLARRPDLKAATHRMVAAGYLTNKARAELFPAISLNGSAGGSGEHFRHLSRHAYRVWSFSGDLTQPLFQGGRLRANLDKAKSERLAMIADFEEAALKAFQEVESSLEQDRSLTTACQALSQELEASRRLSQLSRQGYAKGTRDVVEISGRHISQLRVQSRLLTRQREQLDNRIDLHLALGGGWQ